MKRFIILTMFMWHICLYTCVHAQETYLNELRTALENPRATTYLRLVGNESAALIEQLPELINLVNLSIEGPSFKKFPKEVLQLTKLSTLSIERTQIEELPKEIGNLVSLTKLKIVNNEKLLTLPSTIGNLKNLKYLRITQGTLKSIPKEIGNLAQLEDLYLFFNQLKTLPNELNQLKKLERMLLHENPFEAIPTPLYSFLEKYGYGDAGNIRELRKSDEKMKKYAIWALGGVFISFFVVMFILRKRNFKNK